MIIPFLDLLFKPTPKVIEAQPLTLSPQAIIDNFYSYLNSLISEYGKLNALMILCLVVVGMFFFKNLFRYLAMYFIAPIRNGVVKDIRNDIFNKVLILPLSYFSEEKKGDLMARMSHDVQEIEWSIMSSLEVVFREPLAILTFLVTMFIMSPELSMFVLVLLPITGFLIGRVGRSLRKTSMEGQKKMGHLFIAIEETLTGLRIIKAFTAELFTKKKFNKLNQDYYKLMVKMYRKRDLSAPMSEFLGALVLVIIMYFGGQLVLNNTKSLDASVFIAFIAIFSQIIPPAKAFSTAFYNIQKGIASANRVNKILEAKTSIIEIDNPKIPETFSNEILYKNVSFTYGNRRESWVLKNINLKIQKGKTIALVGQSGSGKTTLADLLPRFYDPTEGEIFIDGVSIKECKLSALRGLMGIVSQESILFNDTVFNNIAFGMNNVNEKEVERAAIIANAHNFIMEMPEAYHTNIGDRGSKLSGGQRQRLSIARAILKNPPILILDEATSALDTESEKLVQEALLKLMQNRTTIVIAHRLSTIQHADEIIVLQKGEIAERGSHGELLLHQKGIYKKLYDLQAFI